MKRASLTAVDALVDFLGDHVEIDEVHVEVLDEALQPLLDPDRLDLCLGAVPLDDELLGRLRRLILDVGQKITLGHVRC